MQHLQCLGIASLTLVVGLFVKFIPIDTTEEEPEGDDKEKNRDKPKTSFGYSSRGGMKLYGNASIGSKKTGSRQ